MFAALCNFQLTAVRLVHSTGQITTLISADCTRLDMASGFFHVCAHMIFLLSFDAPYRQFGLRQSKSSLASLYCKVVIAEKKENISSPFSIVNLGVSALVGVAVLCVSLPIQAIMIRRMVNARRKSVRLTDKRVRLLHEILQGIRLLVFFVRQAIVGLQTLTM